MGILDQKFYDVNFSPAKKEIDRGEYRGYGYVIGEEDDGTVLFIFCNEDLANITVFIGDDTVSLKDGRGLERSLEITRQNGQKVFSCRYGKDVPLERVKDDIPSFVDAIRERINEYIRYCMTHDD
jgi:hypothetical protein